jgi:hypothetical protein
LLTSDGNPGIIVNMRTTLSLDDDLFPHVRTYAATRDLSLGKAVSELVRRGLRAPLRTRVVNGFRVVDLPEDSPVVTRDQVRKLIEEME